MDSSIYEYPDSTPPNPNRLPFSPLSLTSQSRGDVHLRLAFRGGIDEAKAAASRGIMLHLLLALMVLHSSATGEVGSCCTGVRAWIFVVLLVMLLLPFWFKDAGCAAGVVDGGRLDLPRSSLSGGLRRWRAQIQEWDGSGRGPGRWATADVFIPSLVTGVYFGSFQSLWAMGLILLKVMPGVFFFGGGRR